MSPCARNVLLSAGIAIGAFAAGSACGLSFYPQFFADAGEGGKHEEHHDHDEHAHEEHDDHLALTKKAFENLQLRLGAVSRGDYWQSLTLPGEVIEIAGRSDMTISAPVSGIVEHVSVVEGQAVIAANQLLALRITDENLTQAQAELLSTLARRDVLQQEIARLTPLTESGGVPGSRKRELEYELAQSDSVQAVLRQKIRAYGLPEDALADVVATRSLATQVTVGMTQFPARPETAGTTDSASTNDVTEFSVEAIYVHPGKAVERGTPLCDLAYHAELQIKGVAFEGDMPLLSRVMERGWTIRAAFGHHHEDGHSHATLVEDLELLRLEGAVDRNSQTYGFFLPLPNEVAASSNDKRGRTFHEWKFKPGQRAHLQVPVEHWTDQWLLPYAAVVTEGPNAFVFVEHKEHERDTHHGDDHHLDGEHHDELDHEEVFVELEPVPVTILHRDSRTVVIADDGQITPQHRVALNGADKLYLAFKMQQSGGGAHHHHHDH